MKTRMPFGGFFLKLLDEQNGTCEYEEYQRKCEEEPLTEEEQKEQAEQAKAVNKELERLNAESEQNKPEVVPKQQLELIPAETMRWSYASELIGNEFRHWGNGRVILDMGTGCGKSEFIIRKMAGWAVDQMLHGDNSNRILYLCSLTILKEELRSRHKEEALAAFGSEMVNEWDLYKDVLTIETYQHMEKLCRGDEKDQKELAELLAHHRIIVTDECHYWSEFSSFNINTHYSLEAILVAEKDHTVVYMSATGQDTWKLIEEQGGPTSPEHIYRLPQSYEHVKAAYFYARYNLVAILKNLPAGEKAIVFVEMGDDLVEMEKIFGDAAGYYCSPYNERYQKKYSDLSCCVKDGRQLKDILFTTKAMGVGIGIKDRTVKHIFIDQWHPLEIAQSLGRKRTLDADDTCTVYFRDYGLDWYWGTNSGLKKFRNMLLTKYQPAQAYIAGEEEFEKYLHSDTPEVIQKRIDKSKILEHNVVTGYHLNPLGVRQVKNDLEMLYDIMGMKSYPEAFMKYAMFDLHQPIKAYRFKDLEEWLYAHLNQPMNPEEMTAEIIKFGYIERYYDRMPGQVKLNDWLQGYGVKIVSDRDRRRGENYQTMYWKLIEMRQNL